MSDAKADLPDLGPRKGVPRISPQVDWSKLVLNDEHGFVLSRVDGRTSLGDICLLAPFPEGKTIEILRALFNHGVIDVPGVPRPMATAAPPVASAPARPVHRPEPARPAPAQPAPRPEPARPARVLTPPAHSSPTDTPPAHSSPTHTPPAHSSPTHTPPAHSSPTHTPPAHSSFTHTPPHHPNPTHTHHQHPSHTQSPQASPTHARPAPSLPSITPPAPDATGDEACDLPPEVRARVDEMLATVSRGDPAVLLGVPAGADKKEVRRAYFRLSKEFHPDRYFKRQLGPYKKKLQLVFNALTEAADRLGSDGKPPS